MAVVLVNSTPRSASARRVRGKWGGWEEADDMKRELLSVGEWFFLFAEELRKTRNAIPHFSAHT